MKKFLVVLLAIAGIIEITRFANFFVEFLPRGEVYEALAIISRLLLMPVVCSLILGKSKENQQQEK